MAVLGASGSGKSSVVRAGLVPRLRSDPETVWDVVTMVPTARPLNSLVNAFSPLLWPDLEDEVDRREKANEKTASLEKGTLSLRDLVEIALNKQPGTQRLLLVVDQWEELYTLCRDDKVIRSFTDQLLDASQTAPLTVVFTCRADFYGHVLDYRPLVDRIRENAQVSLGPMDEKELREVVEAPAAKVGLEFEPGLSRRILGDVGQEPGRLPLLSFLLEQLWKQRRGAVLTNEAYDAMGGVDGAIATVAEDVFNNLPEPDQERLSKLFIQLVSVGEESEDTRRRAAMTTLGEAARPLVAELATARLLVTSSDQGTAETVEVAHEALIRHWKRSQGWVNNARGFLTWRKRLEPFVDEWQKLNRDRTALLRGGLLAEAQRWLTERRQDLDAPEREFIEASIRQQEASEEAEAGGSGSSSDLRRRGRGCVPGNEPGRRWHGGNGESREAERTQTQCQDDAIEKGPLRPRASEERSCKEERGQCPTQSLREPGRPVGGRSEDSRREALLAMEAVKSI